MSERDAERQPLLKKDNLATNTATQNAGLPWSQVIILGLWRGTHVSEFLYYMSRLQVLT